MTNSSACWDQFRRASLGWATPYDKANSLSPVDQWRLYAGQGLDESMIPTAKLQEARRLAPSRLSMLGISLNFLETFCDARAAAITFEGFKAEEGTPDEVLQAVELVWAKSGGGELLTSLALTLCVTGQAYLAADYRIDGGALTADNLVLTVREPFDGTSGIRVDAVDSNGVISAAEYRWVETVSELAARPGMGRKLLDLLRAKVLGQAVERAPRQQQTRTWRYTYARAEAEAWVLLRTLIADGAVEREANGADEGPGSLVLDYGCPFVQFLHPAGGEIRPSLAWLQTVVNLCLLRLLAAGDDAGFRKTFVLDAERAMGLDGKLKPIEFKPGGLLFLDSRQPGSVKVEDLPPAPLKDLRDELLMHMQNAAWLAAQPAYSVPGADTLNLPSGRALQIARGDCDRANARLQTRVGGSVVKVNHLIQRMLGLRQTYEISPDWQSPTYNDPQGDAQEAQALVSINADPETMAERLNFDAPQKDRYLAHVASEPARQAERQAAMMSALGGGS